jgi:hypothetical protein
MTTFLALAIVIHLTNAADAPASMVRDAQAHVTALFHEIGVDITWSSDGSAARGERVLRLTLIPIEGGALLEGPRPVLGAAMPNGRGGGTAWVFYRRVERAAERHAVAVTPVLACAMAHEIGHLLQIVPAHSGRGVMRADWGHGDYVGAAGGRLRFTPADIAAPAVGRAARSTLER